MYDKKQFIEQKKEEQAKLKKLYADFVSAKSLADVMTISCSAKQVHNYSLRNSILTYCQATRQGIDYVGIVNSFNNWKKQGEQVLKGSKSLKILVPIVVKKENEKENKEDIFTIFKLGNVFDICQTSAYEKYKKDLAEKDRAVYKNSEMDYTQCKQFVQDNFSHEIVEDFKLQECKGSYFPTSKRIELYTQSSHTLLHEFSHYLTITQSPVLNTDNIYHKNSTEYAKNEILAEMTTYIIMTRFGIEDYNFNYSNLWTGKLTDIFTEKEFSGYYKKINSIVNNLKGIPA